MYEIEAKVRLSKLDYERLNEELPRIAEFKGKVSDHDRYFNIDKEFSLRVRRQSQKSYLHLKRKEMNNGTEANQEIEFELTAADKMTAFLKKIGIDLPLKKDKVSEIYQQGNMRMELNYVRKLGYFLEIETLAKAKSQIPEAKKALLDMFGRFGFKPKDFEKRYYLEMLSDLHIKLKTLNSLRA